MQAQKFVYEGGVGEIEEKKSRFIASVWPVHSEQEALDRIAAVKKQYWDARHNCYAYVIGDRSQLQRCSDDGEPQGTAGRPLLDILLGQEMHNTMLTVTRYFGGVLLGTGGLVRTYTQAGTAALKAARIADRQDGYRITIRTDYNALGKVQYLLAQRGIFTIGSEYTDEVSLRILAREDETEAMLSGLTEATNGKAQYPEKERVSFAIVDQQPVLL